jgi:LuxR family maltose regulon positive regulatory protein
MPAPILATKLYRPPPRPGAILRPRLSARLDEGLAAGRKLTLISAPAGFGKTTLVCEWLAGQGGGTPPRPAAWLSLDAGDSDPARFLAYLVAALQTISASIGAGMLAALESPQPPPAEALLTVLLNELAAVPQEFILILDDYHLIEAKPVDQALTFLLQHLPPQMHLVIATREDPPLPLARLRARGQLIELRAAELRFTPAESADFLNRTMRLNLSADDAAALERRTEGWIAGLQLAALSMRGHPDTASFIESFTGSHHFVLDYLMEEVLGQQSESVQTFLLRTSILDRLCGPLCDAVLLDTAAFGQETLEYLEHANLFIVPLDSERRWYRYHHLFADLLRQRLHQSTATSARGEGRGVAELHSRASQWYEDHGLALEAFQHAAAANDVGRAERLIDEKGLHLHLRGVTAILDWLASLPTTMLDARPSLWVRHASALLMGGQTTGVEEKLNAAEAALAVALQGAEPDDKTRTLMGQIAAHRATLALNDSQLNAQSRALDTFRRYLELLGDPPPLSANEVYLGMGRIFYEWNDLDAAEQHLQQSLQLARQYDKSIDTFVICEIYLARQKLARGDVAGAAAMLAETEQSVRQNDFVHRMPEVAAAQVKVLLRQGNITAAADLAGKYELPLIRARVLLAQGDPSAALAVLRPLRQQMEARGLADERFKAVILQAVALRANGEKGEAVQLLGEALALAEPEGFIRIFVDEGEPMRLLILDFRLWIEKQLRGQDDKLLAYVDKLLAAFQDVTKDERRTTELSSAVVRPPSLVEPLSGRELEILKLVAQGLANREIGERLFLALDTVKGHNRRIFDKLQVQSRTEAIARAHELGLL